MSRARPPFPLCVWQQLSVEDNPITRSEERSDQCLSQPLMRLLNEIGFGLGSDLQISDAEDLVARLEPPDYFHV